MKKIFIILVQALFAFSLFAQYSFTSKDLNPVGDGQPFSLNPQGFLNGKMYFNANDGVNGFSLWETDGTLAGTKVTAPVYADKFINYKNKLYFRGGSSSDLYVTDGTLAGTKMVSPSAAKNPFESIVFDGRIFFGGQYGGNGSELWVSDGTDTGTHLFKDINVAGTGAGVYYSMTIYNGKMYFEGDNGSSGRELFVTDGTPAGTSMLKDIYPGATGSFPRDLTVFNGKLYFRADNGGGGGGGGGTNGVELWSTDGTTIGTQMVKDINVGATGGIAYSYGLTLYNSKTLFWGR
jgi:ELWxxDGT repeat protein